MNIRTSPWATTTYRMPISIRIRSPEAFTLQVMWRTREPQTPNLCDLCAWLSEGLPLYREKPQKYVSIARAAIQRFRHRTFLYKSRN